MTCTITGCRNVLDAIDAVPHAIPICCDHWIALPRDLRTRLLEAFRQHRPTCQALLAEARLTCRHLGDIATALAPELGGEAGTA